MPGHVQGHRCCAAHPALGTGLPGALSMGTGASEVDRQVPFLLIEGNIWLKRWKGYHAGVRELETSWPGMRRAGPNGQRPAPPAQPGALTSRSGTHAPLLIAEFPDLSAAFPWSLLGRVASLPSCVPGASRDVPP